ncbi:MAG: GMC family oxidoreductase [Gemmatimonadetes bacterium]|nr:GMC family oxidoreductase [Gemmatimonadota bacterium]
MARVIESDLCIIGAGITAAMVAEKLAEEREARIVVVEGGSRTAPLADRFGRRERHIAYNENPWPDDHIPTQSAQGIISRSMVVGGLAMHWGGTCPRFTPEDLRVKSLYGAGDDWALDYDELEPYYQDAEERIGVAGEQGPPELDLRSKPYPMPPAPLSYSLLRLKEWGERSGIPFWTNPVAKATVAYRGRSVCARCDTCNICPTGAKYSPDFTFNRLLEEKRIELVTRTLVRRLVLAQGSDRVEYAEAVDRDRPEEPVQLRARVFVVAAGYAWSPYLLLISANERFPDGLANRSGLVGKYMCGHRGVNTTVEVPMKLYPGMYASHSLLSKRFQRPGKLDRYVRHDLRIWESSAGREPRIVGDGGQVLLGDEVMADWRLRTERGAARLRAYYDVLPARGSQLTLDPSLRNRWGDPLPRIEVRDSQASRALREYTENRIRHLFEEIARAGGGKILSIRSGELQDHPAGGCRMGSDPATSVTDSHGRTHDHENLFVVGAPTMPTAGCANGTLTFSALSLRSAATIGEEFAARASERASG